jgi:hypothetical protein
MELLTNGHPIYFSTLEVDGSTTHHRRPSTTTPDELNDMEAMIRDQLTYLGRLLNGLRKAAGNLKMSEQHLAPVSERNRDVE